MSQTTVSAGGQAVGFAGQLLNPQDSLIVSGFSREATARIPFGGGVMNKAGEERGYLNPTGASGTMEITGVVGFGYDYARAGALDSANANSGNLGATGVIPAAPINILRRGRIRVPVAYDVRVNDRAFCYVVSTGTIMQGVWAGTNLGGSYVRDCSTQGVFRSATFTSADGVTKVAVLEVDFVNKAA